MEGPGPPRPNLAASMLHRHSLGLRHILSLTFVAFDAAPGLVARLVGQQIEKRVK